MANRIRTMSIKADEDNGSIIYEVWAECQTTANWITVKITSSRGDVQKVSMPCDSFNLMASFAQEVCLGFSIDDDAKGESFFNDKE